MLTTQLFFTHTFQLIVRILEVAEASFLISLLLLSEVFENFEIPKEIALVFESRMAFPKPNHTTNNSVSPDLALLNKI